MLAETTQKMMTKNEKIFLKTILKIRQQILFLFTDKQCLPEH